MSVVTPTILPRPPLFPRLLPKPPHPQPVPLPKQGKTYGRLNASRNLQREMDDLSDEENELDELNHVIRARGFANLIPMGRSLTQQEEKNDAEDDEESESDSAPSNGPPSVGEDPGDSTQDLDASMEDLDEQDDDDDSEEEEEEEEFDLDRSSEQ
ncbi:hypothetical protein FB45DRAFT_283491 [Roridomyces roridus]|uniref:Uncharacterized protein n=1 Tax=Roridomyces roridus TaxID=1738132 RepID=A0AAD7FUI1_9AGAR|nr:hypothetical protein FB45DRAFT_283491 [Roridomyces roridus]